MAKVLLLGFGALALVMGGVFGWIGVSSRGKALRAAQLKPLDARAVTAGRLGVEGYVEGRISERNPVLRHGFVFYYRSVLHGFSKDQSSQRRPVWKPLDTALPPLWLETASGDVRIFGEYSVGFQGRDPARLSTEELEPGTTERYEGLSVDDPVTAVGRVGEADGERGIETETLSSGSFADYLSAERGSAMFGLIAGAVLGLAGIVLIVIAVMV